MDRVDEPVFIVKRLAGKLVVYLSSFVMSLARGRYLRVWSINREIIILKRLGGEDNFSQRNWTILRKAGVDIGQVGSERSEIGEEKSEEKERGFQNERTEREKRDEREGKQDYARQRVAVLCFLIPPPPFILPLPPLICNFFGFLLEQLIVRSSRGLPREFYYPITI